MAYATKQLDHEKRKAGTGSYSPYNYVYHYLMDNYEPNQDLQPAKPLLQKEYKAYCIKCNIPYDDSKALSDIDKAIANFIKNDGKHGDTAHNLGKTQSNSFNVIKDTISGLRW